MAEHTEEEFMTMRKRADRAETELAALRDAPKEAKSAQEKNDELAAADGDAELRKDSMMAHLMDSLEAGKDIGHYGRLVFAIVARHFLPHEEVLAWLMRDYDFTEAKAHAMLQQVEERGYNPPKRERILEWQQEQEFSILPNPEDPDCGNLYRSLKFPNDVYHHIEEYQEQHYEAVS